MPPPRPGLGRPRKRPRQSSIRDPERLNGQTHFLGKRQSRECVVCSGPTSGERRRTLYFCKTCSSQPSLCPDICFEAYRTEEGDFPESMQPHVLLLISCRLFMSHYLSADMLVSTLPTHLPVKLLSGCKDLGKKYSGSEPKQRGLNLTIVRLSPYKHAE